MGAIILTAGAGVPGSTIPVGGGVDSVDAVDIGNKTALQTSDSGTKQLLQRILAELQVANLHNTFITDEELVADIKK